MKTAAVILKLTSLAVLATARPLPGVGKLVAREVPQEHSHQQFITSVTTSLNLNNPDNIQDAVFGLLGDAVCFSYQSAPF
jgi:hypothetical protein